MTRERAIDLARKLSARAAAPSSSVGERAVATRRLRELVERHALLEEEVEPIGSASLDGLTWWRLLVLQALVAAWPGRLRVAWRVRSVSLDGPGSARMAAEARRRWAALEEAARDWDSSSRIYVPTTSWSQWDTSTTTTRTIRPRYEPLGRGWATVEDWLTTAAYALAELVELRRRNARQQAPAEVAWNGLRERALSVDPTQPAGSLELRVAGLLTGPVALPEGPEVASEDIPGPTPVDLDLEDVPRPERRYAIVPAAIRWVEAVGW